MSDIAIRVEGLSKQYRIGLRERYKTLRDALSDALTAPFRALANLRQSADGGQPPNNFIWALKDVSFEIKRGEVVGIIGRNGAGKSTLLKILSRITEPTEGEARIRGRVGSLLEVGTGFSQELTGRENIYLNGAILGMRKSEIDRKFDEIVAFAEVERFIDTPVKHYSSGMYLRLAFAVAAHLEPEILLVDEVLAVGDAEFQKKCLGKMNDVAKQGRTVLFVSHSMPSITMLCNRALLLSSGVLVEDGEAGKVVSHYLASGLSHAQSVQWETWQDAPGSELVRLRSVRVLNRGGEQAATFGMDEPIFIELTYWVLRSGLETNVSYHLFNAQGILVYVSNDFHDAEWLNVKKSAGVYRSVCEIPGGFLNEGAYTVTVAAALAANPIPEFFVREAAHFELVDAGPSEVRGRYTGSWTIGVLRPKLNWKTTRLE